MTVHACWSEPIKDSSSLHVHDFCRSHCESVSRSLANFSSGSLNSCLMVSVVIPRNDMVVLALSCFSEANGTPTLYEESGGAQNRPQSWGDPGQQNHLNNDTLPAPPPYIIPERLLRL